MQKSGQKNVSTKNMPSKIYKNVHACITVKKIIESHIAIMKSVWNDAGSDDKLQINLAWRHLFSAPHFTLNTLLYLAQLIGDTP